MEKIKIDLDIILPDVPDEKDACVQRIISSMETKRELRKFISWLKQTRKSETLFSLQPW